MGILDGDYYEKQTRKFQLEMLANARVQTEMLSDIYISLSKIWIMNVRKSIRNG